MTHYILPGSFETERGVVRAGVHTGSSEFQIENLRYVEAKILDLPDTDTVAEAIFNVYDNSEGCLLKGDFRMKDSKLTGTKRWLAIFEIADKYKDDKMSDSPISGADHDIVYLPISCDQVAEDSDDGKALVALGCHQDGDGWSVFV